MLLCNFLPVLFFFFPPSISFLKLVVVVCAVVFYRGSVVLRMTLSKRQWGRKDLIFILREISGWEKVLDCQV